jgi:hypothetical protein
MMSCYEKPTEMPGCLKSCRGDGSVSNMSGTSDATSYPLYRTWTV